MKALRITLYVLGGVVALAALGIGVAFTVVDGNFVKARAVQAMKEKNRTLVIEGSPGLRLFPVFGLALGKTTLSEPGSDRLFVALESAEVAVRVMPLLSGEVAVETLRLSGLRANVVKRKDGSMNFDDLAGGKEKKEGKAPPNLRLAGVQVEKLQLNYRDEATGQEMNVTEANLKTGRLDGQTPGEVALSARITGKRPELDLRAQASGGLRFNLGREEFAFDKFGLQVKGRIDQDTLSADFSAPKVEVTPAKASGTAVTGAVVVKGPQRNVDAKLRIAAVEGTANALSIPSIALELAAAAGGIAMKANLTAAIKANLAKQDLDADISGKLDDSALKAKVSLTNYAPLAVKFDASFDRLNVDRYLPPEKKDAKPDERIDLSGLKGPKAEGKLAIGALTAKRVKMENVKAEIKLAGGKLEVAPHSANLYGGTLAGTLSADANGNRIQVKENIQNVAVGPLLRDATQKDMLEGRGNVTLDINTSGGTVTALKKALAGSARIEMKDGAIKGINLAESARNVKSAVGSKQTKHDPSQKTDFSDMSASFAIKNGVARNDDLKAQSPFLRLGGAGNLDIGGNSIDYLAKATLAATTKGQGGRAAGDVAGLTIPVKLSGPLDAPNWNVDYSGLLGGAGGAVVDTAKKGAAGIKDAAGGVGDAVRGLFKR
jgi:AsmA protein